jgi:hypothetical protein
LDLRLEGVGVAPQGALGRCHELRGDDFQA